MADKSPGIGSRIFILCMAPIVLVWCLFDGIRFGLREFKNDFMRNWKTGSGVHTDCS